MTSAEIQAAIKMGSRDAKLAAIAELLSRSDEQAAAARSVLPSQWVGEISDAGPYPIVAAPPSGFKLVVTAADALQVDGVFDLEDGNGNRRVRVNGNAGEGVAAWTGRREFFDKLRLTQQGTTGWLAVNYHYEPIALHDGLLAAWDFTDTSPLVDKIFGRTFELSGDDYTYSVGQYDEMQRNNTGAFTVAFVLAAKTESATEGSQLITGPEWLSQIYVNDENAAVLVTGGQPLVIGPLFLNPRLFVLRFDPSGTARTRLYSDGGFVAQDVAAHTNAATAVNLFLNNLLAAFSTFFMWNRALSEAEIVALGTGSNPLRFNGQEFA